jgi:hypothetical protein
MTTAVTATIRRNLAGDDVRLSMVKASNIRKSGIHQHAAAASDGPNRTALSFLSGNTDSFHTEVTVINSTHTPLYQRDHRRTTTAECRDRQSHADNAFH